jgi:hypothetical protein
MNTITDSKQINLCSSSAVSNNGKNSVMVFATNGILKKDKDILYNLISVVHCEIPVSYYIVNSNNNYLSLSTGNYTLTNGNYNATTFKTMLLGILPNGFGLSLNIATGIYTINYTSSFTINSTSTCYRLIGFKINTVYTSTSNQIIFPYPCNFLGISRLKIKSNILKTENIDTNSNGRSNLLTTIAVNSSAYGLIVFNNLVGFKCIIPNINIDYIDITITDEYDNIIDFNGIDNFITLQIDSIRHNIAESEDLIHLMEGINK